MTIDIRIGDFRLFMLHGKCIVLRFPLGFGFAVNIIERDLNLWSKQGTFSRILLAWLNIEVIDNQ